VHEAGGGERSDRRQAELGRLLAVAGGYRVLASDGTHLGWLDHVRYVRHADHPDEIIVRGRRLLAKRRRVLPSARWRKSDSGTVRLSSAAPAPSDTRAEAPFVTGSVSLDGWGLIAGRPAARRAGAYR
jgi:hypothetical protein